MDIPAGIELHTLRTFQRILEKGSFSAAARSLNMTQPSVSQQIAKLEAALEYSLFTRAGHDVIPTAAAGELSRMANQVMELVGEFHEKLQSRQNQPKGLVRYAKPESCQWTPHYRRIMSQIALFPEVQFQIEILPNQKIVDGLLEGRLDFGFVVGERLAPELRFEKYSDETYSAVAVDRKLFNAFEKGQAESLRLIAYPGWELFFTTWARANGLWKTFKSSMKQPIVQVGTLAGAIHAIQEGAGVGVIPTHCVQGELKRKALAEWRSSPRIVASNPIYLSRRVGERLPKRVELVLEMLKRAKTELG